MKPITNWRFLAVLGLVLAAATPVLPDDTPAQQIASALGGKVGIVAVVDLPGEGAASVTDLLRENQILVYFQSADPAQVAAVRKAADKAGTRRLRPIFELLGEVVPYETIRLVARHLEVRT